MATADDKSGSNDAAPESSSARTVPRSERPGDKYALVGTVLSGRYRIEKVLGEGGMGAVYQAEHTLMRKRMAIKVLHPEMSRMKEVVARFEREAMAAAHIDHPNVAAATDFGKLEDGSFFLALEFVEGKSLRSVIGEGPLQLGRALHITRQIALGLQRAHGLGIVHRDLKPENVMLVQREGDPDFAKVLDFGIAKVPVGDLASEAADPGAPVLTQAGMIYGTPEYMAPEQALGQAVDARADLYALGVMMFEMIAGVRPFVAESKVGLLGMHVTAPVPAVFERNPQVQVPVEVETILRRLMAKEADARMSEARELIEAIDALTPHLAAAGLIEPRHVATGAAGSASLLSSPGLQSVPTFSGVHAGSLGAQAPAADGKRGWLIAAAAGGVGILMLVVAIASLVSRPSSGTTAEDGGVTTTGTGEPTATATAVASTDERIREGIAMIARGDHGSGIKQLRELDAAIQGNADAHRALMDGYMATGKAKLAMEQVALLLAAKPEARLDQKVRIAVRDTAIGRDEEGAKAAYDNLQTRMDTVGWDDLYDIAYGASGAQYPAAAATARKLLRAKEGRDRMSAALRVTIDLRQVGLSCSAKKYFAEAVDKGDERTLAVLRPLTQPQIVGHFRKSNALACIQKDGSAQKAVSALEARLAKK